ncbi:hypothetical protein TOPH_05279 [Tolypocladium ophioglossoides CBS 100239]|uniref:Uncharacterized protein n=1 Tax=Tolypocladium ophioglossoides (strain CBS 100239) TaxID=1163406 RepID=A0A0L0N7P9_TOLOC|nr:hypothetical protein TOPH_05279 [Tolypocladium ophioglossoides CBS 100239]
MWPAIQGLRPHLLRGLNGYTNTSDLVGTLKLSGYDGIEVQGLNVYQTSTQQHPNGVVALWRHVSQLGVGATPHHHEKVDPRRLTTCRRKSRICSVSAFNFDCVDISHEGGLSTRECFAGFGGANSRGHIGVDDCSSYGRCLWVETGANNGGDDGSAIWISPIRHNLSRIITTTNLLRSTEPRFRGRLYGGVERVTLVVGRCLTDAPPHDFVATFTIVESLDVKMDAVSNTDGVANIVASLGLDFLHGMLVTSDDSNRLPAWLAWGRHLALCG